MKPVERPSPNHDARPKGGLIDILVLHYTGMKTAEEALARLCDPAARVSAHYTIDRDGTVYAHVPEERRAWHAGVSYWAGARDVNARSIGIELVNPGHEFGYVPFTDDQIGALTELARGILARHPIPTRHVVGHSDVAPSRKTDPGELFPWPRLAREGVGAWPDLSASVDGGGGAAQAGTKEAGFADKLRRYGYGMPPDVEWPLEDAVRAFQRHFRPSCIDGIADHECAAILGALLAI